MSGQRTDALRQPVLFVARTPLRKYIEALRITGGFPSSGILVKNPSNSESCTPSSEPFRIYIEAHLDVYLATHETYDGFASIWTAWRLTVYQISYVSKLCLNLLTGTRVPTVQEAHTMEATWKARVRQSVCPHGSSS
jgi:hypothetical protein